MQSLWAKLQILSRGRLLVYTHPTVHSNWWIIIPFGHYFELVEISELYCINSAAKAVYPAVDFSIAHCLGSPKSTGWGDCHGRLVVSGFLLYISSQPLQNICSYRYIATMVIVS